MNGSRILTIRRILRRIDENHKEICLIAITYTIFIPFILYQYLPRNVISITIIAACSLLFSVEIVFAAWRQSLRLKIGSLVCAYLGIILFFGSMYYRIFLTKPDAFVFTETIKEGATINSFRSKYAQLKDADYCLLSIRLVHENLDKAFITAQAVNKSKEMEASESFSLLGFGYGSFHRSTIFSQGSSATYYKLRIHLAGWEHEFSTTGTDETLHISYLDIDQIVKVESREQFLAAVARAENKLLDRRDKLRTEINNMIISNPAWSLFDFFYFSLVTITTLGYGDILPNNQSVRMVVTAETISGVFFIAFALTYLWPRTKK